MSDRIDNLLGKVKISHHAFTLIGEPDVEVKICPMKMKHFKVLLKASEGVMRDEKLLTDPDEVKKIDESFDQILKDCVVEPEDFNPENLFIADWLYLLTMLRAVSKGNIVEFEVPCPGMVEPKEGQKPERCNTFIKRSINLNELEKMPKSDFSKAFVKLDKGIKVYLAPPKRRDDHLITDYVKEHMGDLTESELIFLKLSTCIDWVKDGKKEIRNLNLLEKKKLFDVFSYEEKEKLRDAYDSLSFGLPVYIELKCSKCGHTEQERLVNLSDFFTL